MNKRAFKPGSQSIRPGLAASVGLASLAIMLASFSSADAGIKCQGQFQIIKGIGKHVSPYCQDNYVASIARRTYGLKVSNRAVRQNPSVKARICRQIGHDYRLYAICANHRPGGRGGS